MSTAEARQLQVRVRQLERQLLHERERHKTSVRNLRQERIHLYELQLQELETMSLKMKESEACIQARLRAEYRSCIEERDRSISDLRAKLSEAEMTLDKFPGQKCAICYDICNVVTQCGHEFCQGCIDQWRRFSPVGTCPMCRTALDRFVGRQATVIKIFRR